MVDSQNKTSLYTKNIGYTTVYTGILPHKIIISITVPPKFIDIDKV